MGDAELGAFRPDGPWTVRLDGLAWRSDVDALRLAARGRVPELIRVRRLPPLRALRVGLSLSQAMVPWAIRNRSDRSAASAQVDLAARLRPRFERFGATFVKLGQIVGSAEGVLPDELVEGFKQCRDQVPPEPFAHVRSIVEAELGAPLGELFADFDEIPLAAASVAQVHAAHLSSGEPVVVKVQRPNIDAVVSRDLAVMAWLAARVERRRPAAKAMNLPGYVELFAETIVEELDFRLEADSMLDLAQVLSVDGDARVLVPRPHPELVTKRVLVMERMVGYQVSDVHGIADAGADPAELLSALLAALLDGALIHGVFHGDMHAGNMMITTEGKPCLFDLGITGRLSPTARRALLGFMLSGVTNDRRAQVTHFQTLGGLPADADIDQLVTTLEADTSSESSDPDGALTEGMSESVRDLVAHGGRMPKDLFLYIKSFVYLNGVIAALAPEVDLVAEAASVIERLVTNNQDHVRDGIGIDPTDERFTAAAIEQKIRERAGAGDDTRTHAERRAAQRERFKQMRAASKAKRA
jgi:ubiquinone biosynthesis protein